MTKQEAIDAFGSRAALAAALNITEQAIHQWDDDAIPELRVYQIKVVLAETGDQTQSISQDTQPEIGGSE